MCFGSGDVRVDLWDFSVMRDFFFKKEKHAGCRWPRALFIALEYFIGARGARVIVFGDGFVCVLNGDDVCQDVLIYEFSICVVRMNFF